MANQHVNKVAVNGQTVLDLSGDTVYPGMLAKGITAHDKSGAQITGTLEVPATEERTVELSMPSGNQVILPTSGKVMRKVTVQKPATLLPENIKKDVVIGGVTGTLDASSSGGSGGGETTSLTVNTDEENVTGCLFCLWQTSDDWMGTANFDSVTNFTIPNVIVGGYVIFTRDPSASELYFSVVNYTGVENVGVDPMDTKWDVANGALVLRVTAPSPSVYLLLRT